MDKTQFSKRHMNSKRIVFAFLALAFVMLCSMSGPRIESHKIRRVVLDAGHGGKDPGNLGTGRYKSTEKDVTLDVTLKLGKYIEDNYPDIEVIYTRDDDSFPSLKDRVVIANDNNADLFISVHCDAFTKKSAHGSGTFVMGMHKTEESLRVAMQENASIYKEENYEEEYLGFDPKDPDTYIALTLRQNAYLEHSLNLSQKIQDQFSQKGRVDRGVRQAGYYVICFTTMPSALVELGFLTNHAEEDYLNSKSGKVEMAQSIFKAFQAYKEELEGVVTEIELEEIPEPAVEEPLVAHEKAGELIVKKIRKGVSFEVQVASSATQVATDAAEFKGLREIQEYSINGVYKYTAGRTSNYDDAKKNQKLLREMGFDGAFIIAIKDGERIDLRDAISQAN
ncbi:MAG: N-acetylmuramoyl-L-alanine amidase [Flavobacteriales bacterium]|nr:N-acetylmuramoyl-L-alanine amidase [Flavobacteriales bacterium]